MINLSIMNNYLRIENSQHRSSSTDHQKINSLHEVQNQTINALKNHHYVYIDFEQSNHVVLMGKSSPKQFEEIETFGDTFISGLNSIQKSLPKTYQMKKYLFDQKNFFEKKAFLHEIQSNNSRLSNQKNPSEKYNDLMNIEISSIKDKINPEALEDFLQKKNNHILWRKLEKQQEALYSSLKSSADFYETMKKTEKITPFKPNKNNSLMSLSKIAKMRKQHDINPLRLPALRKLSKILEMK